MSTAVLGDSNTPEEAVTPLVQPHVREAIRQLLVPVIEVIEEVTAGPAVSPTDVEPTPSGSDGPPLTRREQQVLELLVKGMRNKEMAVVLGIADDTVRVHVKGIFSKLNVHTRTAAMAAALRRGLAQV